MTHTIACIGAQLTPVPVLSWMEETAAKLVQRGYLITSGNATGADQAWARGANSVNPEAVTLFLPWDSFERAAVHSKNTVRVFNPATDQKYVEAAAQGASMRGTKARIALLARNAMIVEDVHCVLGYVGAGGGGTMHAFGVAQRTDIITMNVGDALVRASIDNRLAAGEDVRGKVYEVTRGRRW